jgi:transcription elongation factor Elf1
MSSENNKAYIRVHNASHQAPKCSACGEKHNLQSIVEENKDQPDVYQALIQLKIEARAISKRMRNETLEARQTPIEPDEEDSTGNEMDNVSDDQDKNIIETVLEQPSKDINDAKHAHILTGNAVAALYQSQVDRSPSTPKAAEVGSQVREMIFTRDSGGRNHFKCPICRQIDISAFNFQAGHLHPRSLNGKNTPDNLLCICAICNNNMKTEHLYSYAWRVYNRALWI